MYDVWRRKQKDKNNSANVKYHVANNSTIVLINKVLRKGSWNYLSRDHNRM